MEITLARTFLEILRRGSFSDAAAALHVTQTTVTARINRLEQTLGCRLLRRDRGGIAMTGDGERFADHAAQLVQVWETLQRELPLPRGIDRVVTLGGEASLWHPLLARWLEQMRKRYPQLAVRIQVGERRAPAAAAGQRRAGRCAGAPGRLLAGHADYAGGGRPAGHGADAGRRRR